MGGGVNLIWFCLCLYLDLGYTLHILRNTPPQFITEFLVANGLNSLFIIRDMEYLENDMEKDTNVETSENFTMTQFAYQLSKLHIRIAVMDYPLIR